MLRLKGHKKICVNKNATHFNSIKICLRFLSTYTLSFIVIVDSNFKQNTKDKNILTIPKRNRCVGLFLKIISLV